MRLVISIDVEEEGLFSGRYQRIPPGVENVRELHRLEFITSEFGFHLTLLTTYRVAVSPPCQEILQYFRDNFVAEIGAHLHHWSTPPFQDLPYCEPIRSDLLPPPLLENSTLEPDRAISIPIQLPHRLKKQPAKDVDPILQRLGVGGNEFLLYPANFWTHKNHRMLLTAFAIYRARHPESNLRLVCTGALENEKKVLQEAVYRMGQKDWVILPGFLTEEEFTAIFASCLALVYPSLYEGFGMPVLEAMALEKPVICINVASLHEVAGDAAFYFDPRKPRQIVNAIERIATDKDLRKRLIGLGRHRLAESGGPEKMAREYLDVFLDVMRKPVCNRAGQPALNKREAGSE